MGASQSSMRRKEQRRINKAKHHLQRQYDGNWHWRPDGKFKHPRMDQPQLDNRILELEDAKHMYRKRRYLNVWGNSEHEKFPDIDTYYSPDREYPRRLIVQATASALQDDEPRHWGRRKVKGHTPLIIKVAELCLNPLGLTEHDANINDEDDVEVKSKELSKTWAARIGQSILHYFLSILATLTTGWIIQLLLSFQIVTAPWTDDGSAEPYDEYENTQWYWPKHAVNVLDQSPKNKRSQSQLTTLTIPRRLVVRDPQTGEWVVRKTVDLRDQRTGMLRPYIFLSFSRANYIGKGESEMRQFFYQVAEKTLEHENLNRRDAEEPPMDAFWWDLDCVSPSDPMDITPDQLAESSRTKDVNSICDAVRCARRVYVVLPDDSSNTKLVWGQRIWTLPEVLLATGKIRYCFKDPNIKDGVMQILDVTLTDMYESFWPGSASRSQLCDNDHKAEVVPSDEQHEDAIAHLIHHYTGTINLSETQLFTCAIQAMATLGTRRFVEGYTTKDVAYASMGLLSYRITPCPSDNPFQAIARLSLINDSNKTLERLTCLMPYPITHEQKRLTDQEEELRNEEQREEAENSNFAVAGSETLLRKIADRDQFSVHLWDIEPMCSVVGIGDDDLAPTVILDRCRGIPIRWKNFPRLNYAKDLSSFRATLSQQLVYCGAWFLLTGFGLFASAMSLKFSILADSSSSSPVNVSLYLLGVAIFVVVAWIISWFSPWAVRQLCNGGTSGTSCHLVGFEGTMSLRDIEISIYGNFNQRLDYAASSTIFSKNLRHPKTRRGLEPASWEEEAKRVGIPPGHRLFTIVDTGDMTVSVIAAERPPVVALICGREGGMVRSVLCSWRFEQNCLYRETVMRMRSSVEDSATPNDWLKISLASQGDVSRARLRQMQQKKNKLEDWAHSSPPPPPPPKDRVHMVQESIVSIQQHGSAEM
ncbi:hypothetical protein N7495_005528 [Penicillium taxi]|uniref:uncharacterized protein n=1 Tax=Penicillium taxi TaxID=168475 RepID=UPI0025459336|nr:uncharacterized protein N7495_005528 [Penicillium taxi]KAJ5893837.1 hypothetical protein N7495_005528 [Penicillium taxi]